MMIIGMTLSLSETRGVGPAVGRGEATPGVGMLLSRRECPGLPAPRGGCRGLALGATRAKSGASGRAGARRSRPSYRENILSGTGRRLRPLPNRRSGLNQSLVPPLYYFSLPKSCSCNVYSLIGL